MGISNTEYQKYLNEILTFADDTNDVVKDSQGNIIFNRLNQLMSIKLKKSDKGILVEYNNALLLCPLVKKKRLLYNLNNIFLKKQEVAYELF